MLDEIVLVVVVEVADHVAVAVAVLLVAEDIVRRPDDEVQEEADVVTDRMMTSMMMITIMTTILVAVLTQMKSLMMVAKDMLLMEECNQLGVVDREVVAIPPTYLPLSLTQLPLLAAPEDMELRHLQIPMVAMVLNQLLPHPQDELMVIVVILKQRLIMLQIVMALLPGKDIN
jgi:hypothetical protein